MVLGVLKNHATQNRLDAAVTCLRAVGLPEVAPGCCITTHSLLSVGVPGLTGTVAAADASVWRQVAPRRGARGPAGDGQALRRPRVEADPAVAVLAVASSRGCPDPAAQLRYCGRRRRRRSAMRPRRARRPRSARRPPRTPRVAAVAKAVKTFELPNGVKIDVTDGGFMATMIAS
jgi:hypothetical protein